MEIELTSKKMIFMYSIKGDFYYSEFEIANYILFEMSVIKNFNIFLYG